MTNEHGAGLPAEIHTAAGLWKQFAAAKAAGDTTALSALPKVALLFLTRGPMPFEATWEVFLEGMNSSQSGVSQQIDSMLLLDVVILVTLALSLLQPNLWF